MEIIVICAIIYGLWKFTKAQALEIKAKNVQIENTYNALIERKEFAQEAKAQDAETYALAVKIARK